MNQIKFTIVVFVAVVISSCSTPEPTLLQYSPEFGPPETLITVEGENFSSIHTLDFDNGVPADFNPSYGSDHALLFRVPENAPLGDNLITIGTDGGEIKLPFKVTLEAPLVLDFYPTSAPIGGEVTILGENFFDPLIVLFEDSIAADIAFQSPDSLVVIVPNGASKGFIKLKANGGVSSTNKNFTPTKDILISDFDGEGVHGDIATWLFYGNINEDASTAIQNSEPEGISGSFMKISSKESTPIWIGGTEHPSFNPDEFDTYDINSDLNNTFLEFDATNNGQNLTVVSIILKQRNGSPFDFSANIEIENDSWTKYSLPLNRFKDIDGLTIDPQDIKLVKLHLVNPDNETDNMEINIDNLKFVEVL